ncbi:hypothetical protein LIER_16166 [Lithospermum erythrorhizon]|uniref:Retrotransposon gag domain-containing protein n=1 Tax=Lithospermum erythrorhizon TaxID=34254 RepID=A0AAV3QA87_LITER
MMITLKARDKLGFLNGEIEALAEKHVNYKQWRKVNSTLISWIMHAMTVEIERSFVFDTDAWLLWEEIRECYGGSNGSRLYKLRRSIYGTKQGTNSVIAYYNKLKRFWDELMCTNPNASYGTDGEERVMQFFMGLNEYDHIRSQILYMDPIPTVSKTYSMVTNVEKQRQVHNALNIPAENLVFQERTFKGRLFQDHRLSYEMAPARDNSHNQVQKGRYMANNAVYSGSQGQDTPLEGSDIMEDNQH